MSTQIDTETPVPYNEAVLRKMFSVSDIKQTVSIGISTLLIVVGMFAAPSIAVTKFTKLTASLTVGGTFTLMILAFLAVEIIGRRYLAALRRNNPVESGVYQNVQDRPSVPVKSSRSKTITRITLLVTYFAVIIYVIAANFIL